MKNLDKKEFYYRGLDQSAKRVSQEDINFPYAISAEANWVFLPTYYDCDRSATNGGGIVGGATNISVIDLDRQERRRGRIWKWLRI